MKQSIDAKIEKLIKEMTIEEKARFCSGFDEWFIEKLDRLDIPEIMMCDGPHGLRKRVKTEGNSYLYGDTVRSTCFPTAAGLACSWNEDLIYGLGEALAKEAKAEQVSILLGPGINIKRSPVCGRNFEYFSEDPFLAGKLAASYIRGVQDNGVGTSLKHFAVNNQEHRRHSTNAIVDMRTLREIYLAAFEIAVKESNPATIMHSYNCINGKQVSASKWLLNDILRDEWKYEGMVMTDWNAINNRVVSLDAGADLEMPGSFGVRDAEIANAVQEGRLDESVLDKAVKRILKTIFEYLPDKNAPKADLIEAHKFGTTVGEESMVLLKNENGILPLEDKKSLCVIGAFAKNPRYQGSGSSRVVPAFVDDILECVTERNGGFVEYCEGYSLEGDVNSPDERLIAEAIESAKKCGRAIIFAGMPDSFESEGYDRKNMNLPDSHNDLISRVAKEVEQTVVVLLGGSPVEMPWLDEVNALFYAYLGGSAIGKAVSRLIYGDVNPSGKLAETFPKRFEHNPSYLNFPGVSDDVVYAEGVFVGYRYYQTKNIDVNFPFGFGLSYTQFEYSDICLEENKVSVRVTNIGERSGKEAVQLYVGQDNPTVPRPIKELKGFKKIYLEPGESKTVQFELDERSFAYYDVRVNDWRVDTGSYTVYVGRNCIDTPLTIKVEKVDKNPYIKPLTINTSTLDILTLKAYEPIKDELMMKLLPDDVKATIDEKGISLENPRIYIKRYSTPRMYVRWHYGKLNDQIVQQYIDEANEKLFGKKD